MWSEWQRLKCCAAHDVDPSVQSIENASPGLGNNFTLQANPAPLSGWLMYYLYGIEPWPHDLASLLHQSRFQELRLVSYGRPNARRTPRLARGYWKGEGNVEQLPQISTSFALLFLSKGRRPVLVSKAKFGQNNDWDRHRSDLADLTTYVESKWKREFRSGSRGRLSISKRDGRRLAANRPCSTFRV